MWYIYIYISVCVSVSVCVCMYVYVYIYICVYIYTYIGMSSSIFTVLEPSRGRAFGLPAAISESTGREGHGSGEQVGQPGRTRSHQPWLAGESFITPYEIWENHRKIMRKCRKSPVISGRHVKIIELKGGLSIAWGCIWGYHSATISDIWIYSMFIWKWDQMANIQWGHDDESMHYQFWALPIFNQTHILPSGKLT